MANDQGAATIGRQIGNLIVTMEGRGVGRDSSHYYCYCTCLLCGREVDFRRDRLLRGNFISCGGKGKCYVQRNKVGGGERSRLYNIWNGMIARCHNENNPKYGNYGARNVSVCDDWVDDYREFKKWAFKSGYSDNLTIDRINNDGGYNPNNCQFVLLKDNSRRKRNTLFISAFGESRMLYDWSLDPRCKVTQSLLYHRIRKLGWEPETAISIEKDVRYSHSRRRNNA